MKDPTGDEIAADAQHGPVAPELVSEPSPQPPADGAHDAQALAAQVGALIQRGRVGANWFYWVAALSVVNSVIMLTGGDIFFVIGLGVTLIADATATGIAQAEPNLEILVKVFAFVFDLIVALVVGGFGWLSGRRYLAPFCIGMVLYLGDGLIFVCFQDWMSAGFHAFALVCMWNGFSAYRQLKAMENALSAYPLPAPGVAAP